MEQMNLKKVFLCLILLPKTTLGHLVLYKAIASLFIHHPLFMVLGLKQYLWTHWNPDNLSDIRCGCLCVNLIMQMSQVYYKVMGKPVWNLK